MHTQNSKTYQKIIFVLVLLVVIACLVLLLKNKSYEKNQIETQRTLSSIHKGLENTKAKEEGRRHQYRHNRHQHIRSMPSEVKEKIKKEQTVGLKVVFLTFDDGPSEHTQEVLDILDQYNVPATFFVNTHENQTQMYQEIVRKGHLIANHTQSHNYGLYDRTEAFIADVQALDDYIHKTTKGRYRKGMFRFPGGSLNANAPCRKAIVDLGYNYVDWNVSSGGGASEPVPVPQTIANVVVGVRQHNVSVVLCHGEVEENTRKALPDILDTLLKEGYSFYVMDPDLPYTRHI